MIRKGELIIKTLISKVREWLLQPSIERATTIYQDDIDDVQVYQLERFNALWKHIQKHVPYYQQLVQNGSVPNLITSWADFATLPTLERQAIQQDFAKYIDPSAEIAGWSTTGGSTGTPFRVPYQQSEVRQHQINAWLGRAFYGIQVSDPMFHLWGHSHRFGGGWKRHLKQAKRSIKNALLGYQTFSAYHLTPQRLREAGQVILQMRPKYIVGYSRSLALLARENAELADRFKQLNLKAVIATTETFIEPDDIELVEHVFGCPVAMEYGAAETGVIAYTHPADQRYRAFWDTFILEAIPINETDAKLLLTSLYPRVMPLIRYNIGDSVRNYTNTDNSITNFDAVLGRDNDLIEVETGSFVHPVALMHCIQYRPGILGAQVIQERDNSVSISILTETPLTSEDENLIRQNLATLSPRLANCTINYVNELEQTIAGKTKWVVRR